MVRKKRMTIEDVRDKVADFMDLADKGQVKKARALENEIHREVLRAIADEFIKGSPQELAKVAVTTTKVVLE